MDDPIKKYLIDRGLLDPLVVTEAGAQDAIMENGDMLALAAGVFNNSAKVLAAVIVETIKPIALSLLRDCHPAETVVLRQAMVEVSKLYDQFEKYAVEYEKRMKEKEGDGSTASGEAAPTIEDNAGDNGKPPVE